MCYVHNPTPLNSRLSWLSHHPQRLSHTTTAKPPLAWPPPRAAGQEDIWVEEGVMGRGSQKQTREISLPSTFCLCPEQSIAAARRGELLTPCSLQLPFGPTQGCSAGHPDPAPTARSNRPPLCLSFWALLPEALTGAGYFAISTEAPRSLITIPHQLRDHQREQIAAAP